MDNKNICLSTLVKDVYSIGPVYAGRLKKLGIETVEDLLYHFPSRYEDFSLLSKINMVQPGETVTVHGVVEKMTNEYSRAGKQLQKATIRDETGNLDVVWFNQPFLIKTIRAGESYSFSGKVEWFGHKKVMASPEYERRQCGNTTIRQYSIHTGRLVPVYPETAGLSSKWLRRQIQNLFSICLADVDEYLPSMIIKEHGLLEIKSVLLNIHFPENKQIAEQARSRMAFEELFFLHLSGLIKRRLWERKKTGARFKISVFKKEIKQFWQSLPFALTSGQNRCVAEIFHDLSCQKPANRLLQGDVGSGKTVVAAIAMYLSYLNGFQSALMAPTEILCEQHYKTIHDLLSSSGIKIALVTANHPFAKNKMERPDIFVGTHALLSEKVKFEKLAMAVIDEQQRFGANQRTALINKGANPHFLSLTATPIPRTIALTLYGDLDISIIDEMPPGRLPVKTRVVLPEKQEEAWRWVKKKMEEAGPEQKLQVFVVCPLIEESIKETMRSVKAATVEAGKIKDRFSDFSVELLHGKMKAGEKKRAIEDFRLGKTDILVATPIVEVGLDIPAARIIIIEDAERFGLAQLHQLRGRVGRRNQQGYCLVFTSGELKRLSYLEKTNNGLELAEFDLKLRGPGEIYGVDQHGFPKLKIASFADLSLIEKTKKAAEELVLDKNFSSFHLLREKLKKGKIGEVLPN